MAKQKRSRQTWWTLYALVLMMGGLLFWAHRLAPSPGWRIFLEVGAVVVGYSLIALWLETHPDVLPPRPSAKADSQALKSPELEIPDPLLSHIQHQFYIGSDSATIPNMLEHSTTNPPSNGHHLTRNTPSLPEEAAE
jgi:hypothetical protein